MAYQGEHLLPGMIGNTLIAILLISSLLACYSFYRGTRHHDLSSQSGWVRCAKLFFYIQASAVALIFPVLFYIIKNHLFEYHYAWLHSSRTLDPEYLLASIWEGQEGSFLLWCFWQSLLGIILIKGSGRLKIPVMAVISFGQFCLATMLAGIHLGSIKIGSNPFVLLRNEMPGPLFSQPDYLSFIKDGNDLNPLLQNYWMVIHPPVLFLGFAACIVPFAFAIAGLWTRNYKDWIPAAMPWLLFAAAALGAGIVMGSMWAYESLTFGGYWAWDPVENASLVPWLLLVAALHAMLVFRHTAKSLTSVYLLVIASYILVLYSTFLTRSGILGDTSVHAFTTSGMNLQLLLFLLAFSLPATWLFIVRRRQLQIHNHMNSTSAYSREWWMFAGSLMLGISGLFILVVTSLPVFNKIAAFIANIPGISFTPMALGNDAEFVYNNSQLYLAIATCLLSGFAQYLKYKPSKAPYKIRRILLPCIPAVLITMALFFWGSYRYSSKGSFFEIRLWLAMFAALYTVFANAIYITVTGTKKWKLAQSVIGHVGFGIFIIGILLSSMGKKVLSASNSHTLPVPSGAEETNGENLTLLQDVRTGMGNYWVTYKGDSSHTLKPLTYYHVSFETKNGKDSFALTPNAFVNYKNRKGLLSNPDARHFWSGDIFAYVTSVPDPAQAGDPDTRKITMRIGDTVQVSGNVLQLTRLVTKYNIAMGKIGTMDSIYIGNLISFNNTAKTDSLRAVLLFRNGEQVSLPGSLQDNNIRIAITGASKDKADIEIGIPENSIRYITLKVIHFPHVALVWAGAILMICSFIFSLRQRITRNKN